MKASRRDFLTGLTATATTGLLLNQKGLAQTQEAKKPDNPSFFDDAGSGGSVIYGHEGKSIASTETKFETMLTARIPIASFRETHRQPIVHSELYTSIYNQYRSSYPPNLFTAYQPESLEDSKKYLNGKTRWKQK